MCLVTEVVASLDGLDTDARVSSWVLRQIIDGFAHLHEQGIVHGGRPLTPRPACRLIMCTDTNDYI